MANQIIQSSKLAIVLDAGINDKGEAIMRTKQVGSVKPNATAAGLLAASDAFGTLYDQAIVQTERRDVSIIEA